MKHAASHVSKTKIELSCIVVYNIITHTHTHQSVMLDSDGSSFVSLFSLLKQK